MDNTPKPAAADKNTPAPPAAAPVKTAEPATPKPAQTQATPRPTHWGLIIAVLVVTLAGLGIGYFIYRRTGKKADKNVSQLEEQLQSEEEEQVADEAEEEAATEAEVE